MWVGHCGSYRVGAPAWVCFRELWLRKLIWNMTRQLVYVNPASANSTCQEYDLFIAVCQNMWDLLYVNAVRLEDRCRTSVQLDELCLQSRTM
jgi:hypothetical protein